VEPATNELMKWVLFIDQYLARIMAIGLIIGGPIIIALSQAGLSIREIAINSRKEYASDQSDYKSLEWIATIFMYIGLTMIIVGIIMLLRSF
jgi:phosphate starvation-inducible membrane PsiE